MPALRCCFKDWAIGSDDFVPWAFIAVIFRGVVTSLGPMFLVLSVLYVGTCPPSVHQANYSLMSIGLLINACILSVDVSILCVSCRGSISQTSRRKLLPVTLYCRVVMFIIELLFIIASTIIAWYPGGLHIAVTPTCPLDTADTILRVMVCLQWFFMAGLAVLYLLALDPLGCCTIGPIAYLEEELSNLEDRIEGIDGIFKDPERRITVQRRCQLGGILCKCCRHKTHMEKTHPHPQHKTYKLYLGRLSTLACCAGMCSRIDAKDVQEVARTMADVFPSTEYVATDIQAGIVLATTYQEDHWHTYHKDIRKGLIASMTDEQFIGGKIKYHYMPPRELDREDPGQRENLYDVEYYFKYAYGAYGSTLLLYSEPYTACCKLTSELRRMGDCCNCHCCRGCAATCDKAAFLLATGLSKEDIAFSSPKNDLFKSPFIVAYDHQRKAVVVAIRGTLSVADAFTDLTIGMRKIKIDDPCLEGLDTYVHKGVYQATMAMYKVLIDEEDKSKGILRECFQKYPDYKLVVTGHSLGAAITSVFGLLVYKEYKEKLQCFAFSNPGCVFSYPLAQFSQRFVLTIVLDNEIIPRLNWHSLVLWKDNVVHHIRKTAESKYQVLYTNEIRQGCCPSRRVTQGLESTDDAGATPIEDVPSGEMHSRIQSILTDKHTFNKKNLGIFSQGVTRRAKHVEDIDASASEDQADTDDVIPAFPPGKILELVAMNCSQQDWCCACCHLIAYSCCPCCRKKYRYGLYWTANEDYCAVKLIGEGYLGCHIPDRMNDALRSLHTP